MITGSLRLLRWFDERVEASSELFGPCSTNNDAEWLGEPLLPDRIYLIRGDGSRIDEKACHRMGLAFVLVPRGTIMAAGSTLFGSNWLSSTVTLSMMLFCSCLLNCIPSGCIKTQLSVAILSVQSQLLLIRDVRGIS